MNETILIRPASMWPVYLPKTKKAKAQWINLALVIEVIIVEENPLKIALIYQILESEICSRELEGIQAEAIIKALEEFQNLNRDCRYHETIEEDA